MYFSSVVEVIYGHPAPQVYQSKLTTRHSGRTCCDKPGGAELLLRSDRFITLYTDVTTQMSDYVTAPEGRASSAQYLGRENRFLCSEAKRREWASVLGSEGHTDKDSKGVRRSEISHCVTYKDFCL